MKITRRTGIGTPSPAGGIGAPGPEQGQVENAQPLPLRDSVSVSERARLLSQLKQEEGSEQGTRAETVSALSTAVKEGRYSPDDRAVAASVLREILAFFVR